MKKAAEEVAALSTVAPPQEDVSVGAPCSTKRDSCQVCLVLSELVLQGSIHESAL